MTTTLEGFDDTSHPTPGDADAARAAVAEPQLKLPPPSPDAGAAFCRSAEGALAGVRAMLERGNVDHDVLASLFGVAMAMMGNAARAAGFDLEELVEQDD